MARKKIAAVGIDTIALYLPTHYLPIEALAKARQIEPEKLAGGLGLVNMALPNTDEDVATMAAQAAWQLIQQENISPNQIGRIYVGTESGLDNSKPVASYVCGMLEDALEEKFGPASLKHCDAVDMTFACIGAVDAMLNCIDWVRGDSTRTALVIASDWAKYALESTGEYTQGAGAVALLIKWHPRIMVIGSSIGVSHHSVHDFFKPRLTFNKNADLEIALSEAGYRSPDRKITLFEETPVYDGQFSNRCYIDRSIEALLHFRQLAGLSNTTGAIAHRWHRIAFHLPYAAHARRVCVELWRAELAAMGKLSVIEKLVGVAPQEAEFDNKHAYQMSEAAYNKKVSALPAYRSIVARKLSAAQTLSGQVGNMYTGSIFLALIGLLTDESGTPAHGVGKRYGFIAYGSGSKSKVFEGVLQRGWHEAVARIGVDAQLTKRSAIDFQTYIKLHTRQIEVPLADTNHRHFKLLNVSTAGSLPGQRTYIFSSGTSYELDILKTTTQYR